MQLYTDRAIDRRVRYFAESKQRKADCMLRWKQTERQDKTKKGEQKQWKIHMAANENENVYT